jgi:ureidoglycolate lyase
MNILPLTAEAFAPFGDVLTVPEAPGREYFERALSTTRPGARPSLSLSLRDPTPAPIEVRVMERHAFSSQSFVPLGPARFLVLVAPHAPGGGPSMAEAVAFLAGPGQGVTYGADVWHHGMTVLDAPARFAVFMWRDGTAGDEEFVKVAPFTLELP